MDNEVLEQEKSENKFFQWIWLLIVLVVFLETPRFLTLLFVAGMFGGVQKLFVLAADAEKNKTEKWPYVKALTVCTLLAFGFGWQQLWLIMVGLALAIVFELYALVKKPAKAKENRIFEWACLLLTIGMLVCLATGLTEIGVDVWH